MQLSFWASGQGFITTQPVTLAFLLKIPDRTACVVYSYFAIRPVMNNMHGKSFTCDSLKRGYEYCHVVEPCILWLSPVHTLASYSSSLWKDWWDELHLGGTSKSRHSMRGLVSVHWPGPLVTNPDIPTFKSKKEKRWRMFRNKHAGTTDDFW